MQDVYIAHCKSQEMHEELLPPFYSFSDHSVALAHLICQINSPHLLDVVNDAGGLHNELALGIMLVKNDLISSVDGCQHVDISLVMMLQ